MSAPNRTPFRPVLLLALAAACLPVPAVQAAKSRTRLHRPSHRGTAGWTVSKQGAGPTVLGGPGRFTFTLPADSSGETFMARVTRTRPVRGNFDARVRYRLEEWPENNGAKVSLGTEWGSIQRVSVPAEGGETYLADFRNGGVGPRVTTTDRTGELRLTRRGNRLAAYVRTGGRWVHYRTSTLPASTPLRLHLAAWSHDRIFSDRPVRVTFDHFTLRSIGNGKRKRVHPLRR